MEKRNQAFRLEGLHLTLRSDISLNELLKLARKTRVLELIDTQITEG